MEEIKRAFERLDPLFDQMNAGIQLIDESCRYLYINSAGATQGRLSRSDLIGSRMQDCYPGIEQTEVFSHIQETMKSGRQGTLENEFLFPDGSKGWFELRIYPIKQGVVITSVDITRRKGLETHLRRAQRIEAAGQLAGGIAHEFNNMLFVIRSMAEMLIEDPRMEGDQKSDLGQIARATDRISAITEKLLSFSGHAEGHPQTTSVNALIEKLTPTLSAALGSGIDVSLDLSPQTGNIQIEPRSLEDSIVSMAINARDAMHGQGQLEISTRSTTLEERPDILADIHSPSGLFVEIGIRDEGDGIDPALIEKIFDPFFSTQSKSGTSLGLSMCWGTVKQAGGTIEVESKPGEGTLFRLYLPREPADAEEASLPSPTHASMDVATQASILVVDDESVVRQVVRLYLEPEGYEVHEAQSAEEALALIAQRSFSLLLSDVLMPGMSGMQLAEQVETSNNPPRILLMSGYLPPDQVLDSSKQWPLLIKPFRSDTLLASVNDLLSP